MDKNTWTKEDIAFKDRLKDSRLKKMRKAISDFDNDVFAETRKENQMCKTCTYLDRDNGYFQAFTDSNCGICKETMTFATSNVDRFCKTCAEQHNICVKCGGTLD